MYLFIYYICLFIYLRVFVFSWCLLICLYVFLFTLKCTPLLILALMMFLTRALICVDLYLIFNHGSFINYCLFVGPFCLPQLARLLECLFDSDVNNFSVAA